MKGVADTDSHNIIQKDLASSEQEDSGTIRIIKAYLQFCRRYPGILAILQKVLKSRVTRAGWHRPHGKNKVKTGKGKIRVL
eukprot:scaffold284336_cov252-Cyclotella_meneghiniana.AAC.1